MRGAALPPAAEAGAERRRRGQVPVSCTKDALAFLPCALLAPEVVLINSLYRADNPARAASGVATEGVVLGPVPAGVVAASRLSADPPGCGIVPNNPSDIWKTSVTVSHFSSAVNLF